MKILFLSDNFPPEFNAPASRTFEHCREWANAGIDVTVVTCFPNFPQGKVFGGYRNRWKQVEIVEGIRVIRVWSFIAPNAGIFKRIVDFLSFSFTAFLAGLNIKSDVIIATSPQFFTAVSGAWLSFFKGVPWVMEVRDIWPESIKAVEALKSNWIISVLERIEMFLYRHARAVVVVTDSFKESLSERGVSPEKIFVVKNGVDLSQFKPLSKNSDILNKHQSLQSKFVVGYVGTHGLAHGLDFIVRCAARVDDKEIHFLFIGSGAEKDNVIRLAADFNLQNITFIDPVDKKDINQYLSVIDVALVPLRKATTFQSVIPSKIFESVAMNIPILLGVDGEARRIVEKYGAGKYFEPENEKSLLSSLQMMRDHLASDKSFYSHGCQEMAGNFDRKVLARRMLNVLVEVCMNKPSEK